MRFGERFRAAPEDRLSKRAATEVLDLAALSLAGCSCDGDPGVLPFMLLMLANVAMGLPLSVFPSVLDGLETR